MSSGVRALSRASLTLFAAITLCWPSNASPNVGSGVVPIVGTLEIPVFAAPSNSSGECAKQTGIVSV